jgi:DNA-binding transcriptional LysR family regulator
MIELRHLRYFVAVAEELHFGRAAARLYMAQPPLSQQIQQLEREIGVRLLERTNRRVRLTEAGVAFLDDARAILAKLDQASAHARRIAQGEAGSLAIGFVSSAMYDLVPAMLRRFQEQHPDVELVLHEYSWMEQKAALRERRIQVGVARIPPRISPPEDGLILETVSQEPLIVAAPAASRIAQQADTDGTIELVSLADEAIVLFPRQAVSDYAQYVVRLCEEAGFTPRIVQEVEELQTAVSLVAAGIGVTMVPAPVRDLRRAGVRYLTLREPAPTVTLTLAYRADETSPVLPHFLALAHATAASG